MQPQRREPPLQRLPQPKHKPMSNHGFSTGNLFRNLALTRVPGRFVLGAGVRFPEKWRWLPVPHEA